MAQLERAFELLIRGYAVSVAAARVGVSTDHLRVMMRQSYSFTPRRIQQIVRLADSLRHQPATQMELSRFESTDEKLQALVGPVGAGHPLADWARGLILLGHRPEYYEREFLQALRENDVQRRVRAQHQADAETVAGLNHEQCRAPVDVEYLLLTVEHAQQNMHMRSRQLRETRRHSKAYARTTK